MTISRYTAGGVCDKAKQQKRYLLIYLKGGKCLIAAPGSNPRENEGVIIWDGGAAVLDEICGLELGGVGGAEVADD